MLHLILLVFAFVMAIVASADAPTLAVWPVQWGWLAFAFFIASLIFGSLT